MWTGAAVGGDVWKVGGPPTACGPRSSGDRKAPGTWTSPASSTGGDDCARRKDTSGPATVRRDLGAGPGGTGDGARCPAGDTEPASRCREEAAKAAAAPVLAALGQEDARLDATRCPGAVRVVTADPVVGGLPTYGWPTG